MRDIASIPSQVTDRIKWRGSCLEWYFHLKAGLWRVVNWWRGVVHSLARHNIFSLLNEHHIRVDHFEIGTDVLNICLNFGIYGVSFVDAVPCQIFNSFFFSIVVECFELLHEVLVGDFVEERLEECDDLVDMGVFFF